MKFKKKINKKIIKISLFVIGLIILLILILSANKPIIYYTMPVNGMKVEISQGDNLTKISQTLKSAGLIKNTLTFKWYVILRGWPFSLKAGYYNLDEDWSIAQVAYVIRNGLTDKNRLLVIPEGMSLLDVDKEIKSIGLLKADINIADFKIEDFKEQVQTNIFDGADLDNNLEGYLFPDSYRLLPGNKPEEVILTFLKNFQAKVPTDYIVNARLQGKDFYSILIMASILEKEIPDEAERYIASGILWKRLASGMKLQVDAVTCYAINKSYDNCRGLSSYDLSIKSPYNTYVYKGLPPTPISNPSLSSIKAALYPKDSLYWYYLSDPKTKKTIFSKTLEEHERSIVKYLR